MTVAGRWGRTRPAFPSVQGNTGRFDTTSNGIGYDTDTGSIAAGIERKFSPDFSVGVMVGGLSGDAFNETGAGIYNLSVGAQDSTVQILSAGLRGEYKLDPAGATRGHGSLAFTTASGDDFLVTSGCIGLPSGLTAVDGIDQSWVDVKLGVSTTVGDVGGAVTRIGAEYRGSFGDDYRNNGGGVFMKMDF